ncbi:molybdopterin-synthase adenylyltransferase MoeB [Frigoriglobus tundricola]|uniref:Molybdopterin-synthase adenylyltransferase n=1 Tax=Frigoriglobus tundricola TaxID=2774151 RepID=A0A6M5YXT6_9BACT|nr:molybdopterin-synthase adenylyltransferase MoeB [Frigoriglobus tundricola]QJW98805.1 Molybdopterin-synthase adenylyltransferase [Frigoriglobus tundricola]
MPFPDLLAGRWADVSLTQPEFARYSRHVIMPEVGLDGQRKLKAAKVLVIGTGGLGSPLALYLAAAGVGTLGLVDFDVVDVSNLQRQIIHGTADVGRSKCQSAAARLRDVNPEVKIDLWETRFTSQNALDIVKDYDVVVDGTDNFPTRYLVNDACVLLNKPNVYGSIFRFDGQATVFDPRVGPCYRCLYPEPPPPGEVPSCAEGGVLGILPGVIGCIQATETIKLILGIGEPLVGRLLHYDALNMTFKTFKIRRDPKWAIGAPHPTVTRLIDYEEFCGVRGGAAPAQPGFSGGDITPEQLKKRIDAGEHLFVLDVRNPNEFAICRIPGTVLVPLPELPARVSEVPKDREVIVHCKSGMRSQKAIEFLKAQGYTKLVNLTGGILGWADKVDPGMPRY